MTELRFDYKTRPKCPRCGCESGNSWSQCEGRCPMFQSPYYDANWKEEDVIDYDKPVKGTDIEFDDDIPF